MNAPLLMAQVIALAADSGPIERIATTFGLNWPQFLAQVASFCIVCAILHRYAYRPVLKMLEVRREQIAQGLATTERINAELARTEAQRQEVLAYCQAKPTDGGEGALIVLLRNQK